MHRILASIVTRDQEDDSNKISAETQYYHKGVKHLCENGVSELPKKYILPISERPNLSPYTIRGLNSDNGNENNLVLPVIDVAQLQGSNRCEVLKTLANACENYGFFQLVNHGIPSELIMKMMEVSRRMFELPLEEREKYMSPNTYAPVRYGTSFNQSRDGVFCWRDFLKLTCHPLSDMLPHWPSSPVDFREVGVAYANENKNLFATLMEAIIESLGLTIPTTKNPTTTDNDRDKNNILEQVKLDGSQLMVVNCYPQCPEPQLTLGMPPHSDYGLLTLLLQGEVEGLQIDFKGNWVTVEAVPNSFIVNVGDHLEIFSNGKYKSVLHRVVVNSKRPRISVASLHSVSNTTPVRPWPKLLSEKNPRRYMDTDFATFLKYISSCEAKKKSFLESRKIII